MCSPQVVHTPHQSVACAWAPGGRACDASRGRVVRGANPKGPTGGYAVQAKALLETEALMRVTPRP